MIFFTIFLNAHMNNRIIKNKTRKYYELCEQNKVILFGIWWNKFYSDSTWNSSLVCTMYQSYMDTQKRADIRKSLVSRRITKRDKERKTGLYQTMGKAFTVKEENTNGCLSICNSLKYGHNMELIESVGGEKVPLYHSDFLTDHLSF